MSYLQQLQQLQAKKYKTPENLLPKPTQPSSVSFGSASQMEIKKSDLVVPERKKINICPHPTDKTDITSGIDQNLSSVSFGSVAPQEIKKILPPLALIAEMLIDLPLVPDDRRFIENLLRRIRPDTRRDALLQYREIWKAAADGELKVHRKANAGRRSANTWIRELMH